MLRLCDALELPENAITSTFGILAVRGAGKTTLARLMAEAFHKRALPFVVIDPVGAWWGLRSSRDGHGPGLPIPIFGGRHGDVPLERTGGALIADLVAQKRLTCVLDTSELGENDKLRFLIDFAERLYRKNRDPLHLFLEEADEYIPQSPIGGTKGQMARSLGAWEAIVRRGRARGLGVMLITQRSAVLAKNVLTQIETLFVLRTTSPQDRNAIKAWVDYQGGAVDMLKTLPSLATGEAWIWSPNWLKDFRRFVFPRCETFDSGATPELHGRRRPATLADVDLLSITAEMAATIERAKADDPAQLRAEIARLATALARSSSMLSSSKSVPALDPSLRVELQTAARVFGLVQDAHAKSSALLEQLNESMLALKLHLAKQGDKAAPTPKPGGPLPLPSYRETWPKAEAGEKLSGAERKILTALAQYPAGRTKVQVAILTGYAARTGHFGNVIGALRSRVFVQGPASCLQITPAGLDALGPYTPLPCGAALREHWARELGPALAKLLNAACDAYPAALTKDELAERAGYVARTGHFGNMLGRLRGLELLSRGPDIRASKDLFD